MAKDLVPISGGSVQSFDGLQLLSQIRPAWQSKNLVGRVRKILPADPSSACQRIFNAAVHDLREKVVIAGIDLATDAAKNNALPPVYKDIDILDNYSVSKLIDLAYYMGLFSRPEWRRMTRCYEIRRDLEHEDDEYEAGFEDCVYIFQTCVDVVLSKNPIHLIKVKDVKDLVEQSSAIAPSESMLDDFESAPQPRQEEIGKFLISYALNIKVADIVRQNAFRLLEFFGVRSKNPVKLELTKTVQERIGSSQMSHAIARVAVASGVMPYLKIGTRRDYFNQTFGKLKAAGYRWSAYDQHGDLLDGIIEAGCLDFCPEGPREKIIKWLVQAYLGERGGRTSYGNVRSVFYSNSAAPRVKKIFDASAQTIKTDLQALADDAWIKSAIEDKHIARRWEELIDIVNGDH